LAGDRAAREKRKKAEIMTIKEKSRRASGRKRDAKGSTLHAETKHLSGKRRRRVWLPLAVSAQPGTNALDNATIFKIIPFP
jgi:hypothetical protein